MSAGGTARAAALPSRRYPKGEQRRRQIVEAAMETFAREGYRGGSLRTIAARVGLTPAGLTHHFASKEELLAEVIAERDERVRAAAGEPGPDEPVEQMRRVVDHNAARPGLGSLYTVIAAEATDPDHPLHAAMAQRYAEGADRGAANLEAAREAGRVRTDLDPEAASRVVTAVMDGLQLAALLDPRTDVAEVFDDFLRGYLRPVEQPPPPTRPA